MLYSTFDQKSQETTFLEKKIKENLPPVDQLLLIKNELMQWNITWPHEEDIKWFRVSIY